jgi:transposase
MTNIVYPKSLRDEAVRHLRDGKRPIYVADLLNVSTTTVRNWAADAGIDLRTPAERRAARKRSQTTVRQKMTLAPDDAADALRIKMTGIKAGLRWNTPMNYRGAN